VEKGALKGASQRRVPAWSGSSSSASANPRRGTRRLLPPSREVSELAKLDELFDAAVLCPSREEFDVEVGRVLGQ
jgi:hypothetical protein